MNAINLNLPWTLDGTSINSRHIRDASGAELGTFIEDARFERDALAHRVAQAEFAVKAANAHEELLAALRELLPLAECYVRDNKSHGDRLDNARAAIGRGTA